MLPFREFLLSDGFEGLQAIALVDHPAIGAEYQAFKPQKFEVIDEEKRIVLGAAMIPDLPIYRRDESGEYYAIFKKDTINQLVQKFFKEQKTSEFNEMHDPMKFYDGVYLYQSFITDEKMGVLPPKGFENIADGTWFIAAKVENDEAWKKVKEEGLLKGFSVEGIFDIQPYKFNKMSNKLEDAIKALRKKFAEPEEEQQVMGDTTLVDGTPIKWDGELAVGVAITLTTPEGEVSAPDGTYELVTGEIISTVGGVVSEVGAAQEDDEFTEEMLDNAIAKALGLYMADSKLEERFKALEEANEGLVKENKELSTKVEGFSKVEETLKSEFNTTLGGIAKMLEELAKTEEPAAQKPSEFAKLDRREKASRMAEIIKSNSKKNK